MITPYQAKYYAYELSKRASSDSTEKFGSTLMDAQVELSPHQVEAALFAFKSPFSKVAKISVGHGIRRKTRRPWTLLFSNTISVCSGI